MKTLCTKLLDVIIHIIPVCIMIKNVCLHVYLNKRECWLVVLFVLGVMFV